MLPTEAVRSRSASHLAWLLAGGLLLPACSEKFTSAGASGAAADGGADGESQGGSQAASGGGLTHGGAAPSAGGRNGGAGGLTAVAGSPTTLGGAPPALGGSGGAGGSGAVAAPPVPTAGLEVWLDADAGITQANGVVSGWKDSSGHSRNALQTASNYRPTLVSDALSGKPAVVFDGVDDYLKLPALTLDFSAGFSAFIALQQDDTDVCDAFFEASNGPEIDDLHVGIWEGSMQYEVGDPFLHATDYQLDFGTPELLSVVQQPSGPVQARRNANGLGEGDFPVPGSMRREQAFIGHSLYRDCGSFKGRIGELLIYSRAVSDEELVDIESYLQTKWGCCVK
jgi:hypothetical protein